MKIIKGGLLIWVLILAANVRVDAQIITSDLKLAGRPARIIVDKLPVRDRPKVVAQVRYNLDIGEWVELTGTRTVMTQELMVKNRRITAPWMEIKTANGEKAWIFAGGIKLCGHPGARLSPSKEFAPVGWIDSEQDFLQDLADDDEAIMTFRFVNGGPKPLKIKRVKTSCPCLQARAVDKPVGSCRKGGVQLKFKLSEDKPNAIQTAFVYFEGYDLPYMITLKVITGQAIVEKGLGMSDSNSEKLVKAPLPATAKYSDYFRNGLIPLHNTRSGRYFDINGKEITDFPFYDYFHLSNTLDYFSEGLTVVRQKRIVGEGELKWEYFFADKHGQEPFGRRFDYAEPFSDGLAIVAVGGKYGIINRNGDFTVEPGYAVVAAPKSGMVWVKDDPDQDEYLIDAKTGERIPESSRRRQLLYPIPLKTKTRIDEVTKEERLKYALVDNTGALISPWLDRIPEYRDGLTSFQRGPRWGFINKKGKMVIHPRFPYVSEFSDGFAKYAWEKDSDKTPKGFINTEGQIKIEPKFTYVEDFVNGYCIFREPNWRGPIGFIDKTGEVVIEPRYEDAYNFYEGLAAVKMSGKWGFIDEKGLPAIPFSFDEVRHLPDQLEGGFSGGIVKVVFRGQEVVIDKAGNCVLGCEGWN